VNINIDLSNIKDVILPKFYPLLFDKHRNLVIYGSAGSGKSCFAAQYLHLRTLLGYNQNIVQRFLVLRKTNNSIRESVFHELKKWASAWGMLDICNINKSNMSFEFTNGSQIISSGLDEVEKLKSITGITSIWIEEANQISLQDFRQINLRLRAITHTKMQIIVTFNPISRLLWLNDHFFVNPTDKVKNNTTIHHSTWRDNKFLDQESIDQLNDLKNQDIAYWKIYSEGEWGVLEGQIYNNYKIIDEFPEDKFLNDIIYGLDFGFNDPCALIQIGKKIDDFYCRELLYKSQLTNEDLIKKLKDLIPTRYRDKRIIYADNAEPARIEEINRAGFICLPAKKDVQDGLDFCKRNKIYISRDSENMNKEIQGYIYKKDKEGRSLEIPLKYKDHTMDAMRYGMYTHYADPIDTSIMVYSGGLFI
jgi:phage terminase large subunit